MPCSRLPQVPGLGRGLVGLRLVDQADQAWLRLGRSIPRWPGSVLLEVAAPALGWPPAGQREVPPLVQVGLVLLQRNPRRVRPLELTRAGRMAALVGLLARVVPALSRRAPLQAQLLEPTRAGRMAASVGLQVVPLQDQQPEQPRVGLALLRRTPQRVRPLEPTRAGRMAALVGLLAQVGLALLRRNPQRVGLLEPTRAGRMATSVGLQVVPFLDQQPEQHRVVLALLRRNPRRVRPLEPTRAASVGLWRGVGQHRVSWPSLCQAPAAH